MDKPTIPEVVDGFAAYLAENPGWGSLHIVLEDDNVSDDHVRFCIQYARETGDTSGERLASVLLRMSRTQRLRLRYAAAERLAGTAVAS